MPGVLRIANSSGFHGDRFEAVQEMVRGGPIDVLTGDYLAELTMAILHRTRQKGRGYVATFLAQLEGVLAECLARGIRVVTNAGGLDPEGLAAAVSELAARLGSPARVAVVLGDDLTDRLDALTQAGETFAHLDRGAALGDARARVLTAHAYLGGWGIKEALDRGADIVICGRVTDAALVVGPAASHFGWARHDWDRLAGAVAAGHILECGTQATGGNYAFFHEVPSLRDVGFPLAEVHEDGSFVITKHPGTGGIVSIGTVTAQLVYEIASPCYANPDVTARFDTLELALEGPDRVRVTGARGEPPTTTTKVGVNLAGGFRNTVTVLLAGLDIEAKARLVEDELFHAVGGRETFATADARLVRRPVEDPGSNLDALAELRVVVTSPDQERVGRRFSSRVVALMLASVPGVTGTAPPGDAAPFSVYWPTTVANRHVHHRVLFEGLEIAVEAVAGSPAPPDALPAEVGAAPAPGPTVRAPLGALFGARSGDKGGNANLGVWARTPEAYAFLRSFLTVGRLRELLPDTADFAVDRHELPNLHALNFVLHGLLGEGVSASGRVDPQAKTLGEYLRARFIDAPARLLEAPAPAWIGYQAK